MHALPPGKLVKKGSLLSKYSMWGVALDVLLGLLT
jgi:hypothetical protein